MLCKIVAWEEVLDVVDHIAVVRHCKCLNNLVPVAESTVYEQNFAKWVTLRVVYADVVSIIYWGRRSPICLIYRMPQWRWFRRLTALNNAIRCPFAKGPQKRPVPVA